MYFVTSHEHRNLTADDLLAARALRDRGVTVEPLVWSELTERTAAPSVLVLRSVWDYHLHSPKFLDWLAAAETAGHVILNPPALVRWNIDKRYLQDLERDGVKTIPTLRLDRDAPLTLSQAVDALGQSDVVIKPAISASAFETYRLNVSAQPGPAEITFRRLRARHDVLVQPYLPAITTEGEWSLVFFGGEFSHAVRKRPAPGDFRVQMDFGGSAVAECAPDFVRRAAQCAVNRLPSRPLYVRIDGVTHEREFLLMEAECIDPVLYFRFDALAAGRFAAALTTMTTGRKVTLHGGRTGGPPLAHGNRIQDASSAGGEPPARGDAGT